MYEYAYKRFFFIYDYVSMISTAEEPSQLEKKNFAGFVPREYDLDLAVSLPTEIPLWAPSTYLYSPVITKDTRLLGRPATCANVN
jgi:hypothetical protein